VEGLYEQAAALGLEAELLHERAPEGRDATRREFERVTNMSSPALRRWLQTGEARSVGALPRGAGRVTRPDQGESVGHASGRRILEIRSKPRSQLTDDDYAHMRKVIGYVHRHLAQRPSGDVANSRWRYSLMNWGHDPL
jgi:hypothetical protein